MQPIEQRTSLIDTAIQDYLTKGCGIAYAARVMTLGLQRSQKAAAGLNFLIDHSGQLGGKQALNKIEFDEKKQANIPWPLDWRGKPLAKSGISLLGQTVDTAW